MKTGIILMAVLVAIAGKAYAVDFMDLQTMKISDVKAATAEVVVPAEAALSTDVSPTPIDGWLDGSYHAHEALDPRGSDYKHVLYATLVKAQGTLYLQAFSPGKMDYLANFKTSPKAAVEDVGTLRSDQGHPYLVAFTNSSHSMTAKTNMLVVEFNSKRMFRFAITQSFLTSDIESGKFRHYVPSDADNRAWSPWIEVR